VGKEKKGSSRSALNTMRRDQKAEGRAAKKDNFFASSRGKLRLREEESWFLIVYMERRGGS